MYTPWWGRRERGVHFPGSVSGSHLTLLQRSRDRVRKQVVREYPYLKFHSKGIVLGLC